MTTLDLENLLGELRAHYPGATYELHWQTPEQLLVATILAAQCTDERVNRVTATLFQDYPDPVAFATADLDALETAVKPTGFYKRKAKTVQAVCRALVERFDGSVPRDLAQLTGLPGVARKTANVVLNCAFNLPSGIIVDTHVARVSQRLGLSAAVDPDDIERDLMEGVPKDQWTFFGPAMVLHGRYVCKSKSPRCGACMLEAVCPRHGVVEPAKAVAKASKPTPEMPDPAPHRPQPQPGGVGDNLPGDTLSFDLDPLAHWHPALATELENDYFRDLQAFVAAERRDHQVFPPQDEVFSAFALTPFEEVEVLILGQDPYHDDGQAHGLSFSVKPGVAIPPSLKNIYQERHADLGLQPPDHGHLSAWARRGVLLLNAVLTVRAHTPNSHKGRGWETLTDRVIRLVSQHRSHVVFVLWGGYAKKKAPLIDGQKHTILQSAHPSPLSARNGFFGSRPFSSINAALAQNGQDEVDWTLPEIP